VFTDETGLMLAPLVRRSRHSRGWRPVMYCWDRHDRLWPIVSLTLAPRRRRIGLYFQMHEKNITAEDAEEFLRKVQRRLRRPVILVLDRRGVHKKAAKALFGDRRFSIERLPPYAPELNPVEHVWDHTRYDDLANYLPDDLLDLEIEAETSLEELPTKPDLLGPAFMGPNSNYDLLHSQRQEQ
jgi:putative transposase